MRFRVRKSAHVLERLGLAMAGAASGLFVGVLVGSNVDLLTSQGFLLLMMIGGAVGFYLGIDTPPLPFHPANDGADGQIDTAEFLSAVGTFLATGSAFASVGAIVLRHDPHIAWTSLIMAGWVIGVTMQIIAGAIARLRRRGDGVHPSSVIPGRCLSTGPPDLQLRIGESLDSGFDASHRPGMAVIIPAIPSPGRGESQCEADRRCLQAQMRTRACE